MLLGKSVFFFHSYDASQIFISLALRIYLFWTRPGLGPKFPPGSIIEQGGRQREGAP
jgi:hypothetical protein